MDDCNLRRVVICDLDREMASVPLQLDLMVRGLIRQCWIQASINVARASKDERRNLSSSVDRHVASIVRV